MFIALVDRRSCWASSRIRTRSLVVFVAVPALFVLGLLLIPFGMWLERRRLLRHPGSEREWLVIDFRSPTTRRRALLFTALTALNVVIVLLAGYGSLHSMESPSFCGQTCHTPMHPQFTAWQDAPHSQVTCVQCHIGEGGRAFVKYKMNGLRQLYHVVTGQLPAADSRCRRHASRDRGLRELSLARQGDSAMSSASSVSTPTTRRTTETATILQMFVGGPGAPTAAGRAIHWHADPRVQIEFIYTDAERQTIKYVQVTRMRRAASASTPPRGRRPNSSPTAAGARWTVSTATTSRRIAIAPAPEQAVDVAIAAGRIRPRPAVRSSRRRAPDEGELPDRRRRLADDRRGLAKVLHRTRRRRRCPGHGCGRRAAGRSTGATCFPR